MQRPLSRSSALARLAVASVALSASSASAADVCYQGGALLPNFQLNGDARLDGDALIVTEAVANQAGSVSYFPKLSTAGDVHISMVVQITESGGNDNAFGADGLAFVLHNSPDAHAALGEVGQGIGYGGISPSVVVEFDTYKNAWDTDDNQVALTRNGEFRHDVGLNATLPQVASPVPLKSGNDVHLWMDYEHDSKLISVFLAATAAKPAVPTLSTTLDLATALGADFFITFTGSTGGAWSKHAVRELYASDIFSNPRDVCCNADGECPAGQLCDPAKHLCGPCTLADSEACPVAAPACSLAGSENVCSAACTGDAGSGGANPCTAAFPACRPDGSCAACNGDQGTAATGTCQAGAPYCSETGFCGRCTSNADCAANDATRAGAICDLGSGACRACVADAECGDGQVCLAAACVAPVANGEPVPGGTCDDTTKKACLSGACNEADDTCGAVTGDACESTAECRTGLCVGGPPIGTCQQCGASVDCAGTTPVCDQANACVACSADFGAGAGAMCPEAAATCFADGSCAKCTVNADCTQGGAHAGAICNPTTGTCGSSCATDAQCDDGWCDTSGVGVCTPRIGNGQPVPGGDCTTELGARVCQATVCDPADDLCGLGVGGACTTADQCRTALCEGGVCVEAEPDAGVPDAGTSSGGSSSSSSGASSSSSGSRGTSSGSGNGSTSGNPPNDPDQDDNDLGIDGLSGGSGCATAGGAGSSVSSLFLIAMVMLSRRRRPEAR